jgi:hypothetical protein
MMIKTELEILTELRVFANPEKVIFEMLWVCTRAFP